MNYEISNIDRSTKFNRPAPITFFSVKRPTPSSNVPSATECKESKSVRPKYGCIPTNVLMKIFRALSPKNSFYSTMDKKYTMVSTDILVSKIAFHK